MDAMAYVGTALTIALLLIVVAAMGAGALLMWLVS